MSNITVVESEETEEDDEEETWRNQRLQLRFSQSSLRIRKVIQHSAAKHLSFEHLLLKRLLFLSLGSRLTA